jgi:carbonic anhydrase
VIEQVVNVCETTIVQDAWSRGQDLTVHGWTYRLETGLVNDLGMSISSSEEMNVRYVKSLSRYDAE